MSSSASSDFLQHILRFGVTSDRTTWLDRMERLCRSVESEFPGERLEWATQHQPVSSKDIAVADRPEFLRARKRNALLTVQLHNGKFIVRHVPTNGEAWNENQGHISVSCQIDRQQRERCEVGVQIPRCSWERCEQLIVCLGDAVGAYESAFSPFEAANIIRASCFPGQWIGAAELKSKLLSVPGLRGRVHGGYAHPGQPEALGWINYWSQETCDFIGFPNGEIDAALIDGSYRTPSGAWLVKLTQRPLDFAIPEHKSAFEAAAQRFDRVGVRLRRAVKA